VRARALALAIVVCASLPTLPARAAAGDRAAAPGWVERIDGLVEGRRMSVVLAYGGDDLYRHRPGVLRTPASNEKLLLAMALFDELDPEEVIRTFARAETAPEEGVIDGDLWIVGRGDPGVDRATMGALARRIAGSGVVRVRGRVMGSTSYFARDWFAPGWEPDFRREEIPLPTALTFRGNVGPSGVHVTDPERRAAESLTNRLERLGVRVAGRPGMGRPDGALTTVATVASAPLSSVVRRMEVDSRNFDAEVLGKLLGAVTGGPPGTIAKGAAAIEAFEQTRGIARFRHFDCSGLSYDNRVTAAGIVRLLEAAGDEPWGAALRKALPRPGQGTLEDRMGGLRVRAKTGTLSGISALSGWVWLEEEGAWAEFSILSRGPNVTELKRIEDRIVAAISAHAP
jgi:D-alanyl-D-alanine carboxypeptidase/D-alanyl-D-alanine-endopeptidase (penicillin-binding protein 4)